MCTGIFLKTTKKTYIYARTLEFGTDLQSQILFIPRNYNFKMLSPDNTENGLAWKTTYAALGANAFNLTGFIDGINEKGLAGGLFYFPEFAKYQEVQPEYYNQSIPAWYLLTWILTNFSSVEEVKKNITSVFVTNLPLPGFGEVPVHFIIHDSTGNSIVIEYIQGELQVHDNPLGVITNAPTFDWHLINLRNYVTVNALNVPPRKIDGITLEQLGQGSGMLGLPGDFTPPSRFVRAAFFQAYALTQETEQAAIQQAFHILHNFDIPQGAVRSSEEHFEYTTWTSACDLYNKIYYWKPYSNFQLQKVKLMTHNLSAKKPQQVSMHAIETIIDKTELLSLKN